jgi:hypothetical protein
LRKAFHAVPATQLDKRLKPPEDVSLIPKLMPKMGAFFAAFFRKWLDYFILISVYVIKNEEI